MSRYPYTVCADALRAIANEYGDLPSRGQMAGIKVFIARALGMSERELACRIADHAIATRLCYDTDTDVLAAQAAEKEKAQ